MASVNQVVRQSTEGSCKATKGKRTIVLLAVATLAAVLCLAGCGSSQGGGASAKVEQKTFPLVLQIEDEGDSEPSAPEEGEMNLYFVNDGDIPYVALSEYLPFFGKLYEDETLGTKAVEFDIAHENGLYTGTRTDSGWTMTVDPNADTISFLSLNGFMQSPGDTHLLGLVTIGENGLGGNGLLKDSGQSYDRQGYVTEFDMSKYGIDLVEADGECYVPLQTMQDILLGRNYMLTVFNGEKVFVFPYKGTLDDQIYSVEPGEMSKEFAKFNVNELMFLIDNFYGLKPEHNIDDIYKFIADTGLTFAGDDTTQITDPKEFDADLQTLLMRYFDDLHSGFLHGSCLSGAADLTDPNVAEGVMGSMGTSSSSGYFNTLMYLMKRMEINPDFAVDLNGASGGFFDYTEVGDTAIITFDSFSGDKRDYYKEADLDNPQDTIELIVAAHKQITRKDSPIKNVVIDLSCNGGGNSNAAAFILAWLTNGSPLGLRDTLTGAQSVVSYQADVNLDGKFDDSDSLRSQITTGDLKVYCLTSPNSFSCGNLVPAALKGLYGITLIGQASGGGSCFVLPCTSASGAQFQISGTGQISSIKNGSFYNADTGVEVDVPIRDLETIYDREKLVDFIHNIK